MKAGKKAALAAGAALGAATLALGGVCYAYHAAFYGDRRRQAPTREIPAGKSFDPYRERMLGNIDRLLAEPYERVSVQSHDGLELVGKFYPGQPGAPMILFFHGYRSTAERDASGGFQLCREKGWHLLMVDQRAHGESQGETITFGVRERYDCQTWARYAARRMGPETPIFLWGLSMGAATVLMASDLPLPKSVRGIVADCSFDSPAGAIKSTLHRRHWPEGPCYRLVALGGRLLGGFRLEDSTPLDCVRRTRLPIFLIHGEADHMVPCEMAGQIRDACASPVTLLTVPGAPHGISWYVDMPAYRAALERFMEENLT